LERYNSVISHNYLKFIYSYSIASTAKATAGAEFALTHDWVLLLLLLGRAAAELFVVLVLLLVVLVRSLLDAVLKECYVLEVCWTGN
jgi:hypothetical protein